METIFQAGLAATLFHDTTDLQGDGEEEDLLEEVALLVQQGQAHLVMIILLGVEEGQLVQLHQQFLQQLAQLHQLL